MRIEVAEFMPSPARRGTITVAVRTCDVCCEQLIPCVCIDSSGDEYGEGCICRECAVRVFSAFAVAFGTFREPQDAAPTEPSIPPHYPCPVAPAHPWAVPLGPVTVTLDAAPPPE